MISAVFSLIYCARQAVEDDSSSSGALSLPTNPHLRSRSLPHRSYSLRIALQFRDQLEHVVIEFRLRQGQRRVAASQHPGGCVRRKAIEIRIAQDFNSLLGF